MVLAEEGAGGAGEAEAKVKTEEVEGSMMRADFAAGIEI